METLLLIAVVGTLNVVCFFIGAKVGQTVAKGETIEAPNLNPIEIVREYKEDKERRHTLDRINTLLENIDNYDGTSIGQKDIPR